MVKIKTNWAKVSEVKAGSTIVTDGGSPCWHKNRRYRVHEDKDGLFFKCRDGHHGLDGQLSDNGREYVGIVLVK